MNPLKNENAVVVTDLVKKFDQFTAVNGISFEVAQGEVFGFLGPNGAGKSTTVRMLCGILLPTSGTGTVAGYNINTQTEAIKSHIGYMSQKFSLYQNLTIEENVDFYSGIYRIDPKNKVARKEWVLEMADLQKYRSSATGILPTGLKQRLALGCALLHEPQILFLDEPTSGVDPINRRKFWDLIYELSGQGVTVLVTTHYMDEAENCSRLGFIYRGELIASGTPETLKSEYMPGDVLEVICDRAQDAMTELEKEPAISEVSLFGKNLHIIASDGEATTVILQKRLSDKGYRVDKIEKVHPSLEDVFVSLIQTRDRMEKPQMEVRR